MSNFVKNSTVFDLESGQKRQEDQDCSRNIVAGQVEDFLSGVREALDRGLLFDFVAGQLPSQRHVKQPPVCRMEFNLNM